MAEQESEGKRLSSVGSEAQNPRPPSNDANSIQSPVHFGGPKSCFSNFFPCDIHVFGHDFHSSEHAYQYKQAIFHEDFESAEYIKKTKDARAAKRASKQINKKNYGWQEKRVEVMWEILNAKANVPEFRAALCATKQAELVEYVPSWEGFWGLGNNYIGGQNMLGKLLMDLRENILSGNRGRMLSESRRQNRSSLEMYKNSSHRAFETGYSIDDVDNRWGSGRGDKRGSSNVVGRRNVDRDKATNWNPQRVKTRGRATSYLGRRERGNGRTHNKSGHDVTYCRTEPYRKSTTKRSCQDRRHLGDVGFSQKTEDINDRYSEQKQCHREKTKQGSKDYYQVSKNPTVLSCDKDHSSGNALEAPPYSMMSTMTDYPKHDGIFYKKHSITEEEPRNKKWKKKNRNSKRN